MTREDIIRMAQEAGWDMDDTVDGFSVRLERFAALVIAAERERIIAANAPEIERCNAYIKALEDNIRARGDKPTAVIYSPGQLAERGLTHEDVVKLIKENT